MLAPLSAAAVVAAQPGGATDGSTITLAVDADARWVPFTLTPGNQIRFDMTIDGRPVAAILDTGVSDSVLARASAAVVPARLVAGGTATAIGGDVPIAWMAVDRLRLGALERRGGRLAVAALPASATDSATPVDLLVGRDLLGGHALDIDYRARRFRLLPSGRMPFRGQIAPLSIAPARQVYETRASLGGATLAPVIVDTDDGSSLTLAQERWARIAPAGLPTTTALAFGLAGEAVSTLAILPELRLGETVAREVEIRVEPPGGFSASLGVAGRIGTGLLQRYRVLLDPTAGRMVLRADPDAAAMPLRSTSGLLVGVAPDRLRVLRVMRGGPAAAGGWQVGDTICAIDGRPIPADYATSALARWSIAAPGTATRLTGCDGRERVLVAARFY